MRITHLIPLVVLIGLAACTPVTKSQNFRILTYNTAFIYAEAEAQVPVLPPYCSTCNPFEPPDLPLGPCFCPVITLWPNHHRFADLGEVERAQKIAERILATDQDVVVLNEVLLPEARAVFEQTLGVAGPYKHYIGLLRGHAPVEGLTLGDLIQLKAGEFDPFLGDLLEDLPEFLDFRTVPGASGLMIFSKYPFLKLEGSSVPNDALCSDPECVFSGWNAGAPIQPDVFAFKVFDACSASVTSTEVTDCWASKGVGFVKIATPGTPRYVAFTHMQADYPEQGAVFPDVRAKQFEEIRDLIVGAIPSNEIATAAVYLAGDLNVAGASRTSGPTSGNQEWRDIFEFDPASNSPNVAGGFFACSNGIDTGSSVELCQFGANTDSRSLTDAWGFETSPTDRGISNETDDARLDFIVHSSGGRICMQHAMIAYDLQADPGGGGLTWLSDHLPVRVDFGTAATFCSPNDDAEAAQPNRNVHEFQFGPTNCSDSPQSPPCHQDEIVAPPTAQIGPAGAFQWFRINAAGTYSINLDPWVSDENVAFVIYHHTDLSRPIAPFEEQEGEFGIIYSMPEPPYYIRTFAVDANGQPDHNATGRQYTLKVHQHLCRSPIDACVLDPGLATVAPYQYIWPTSVDILSDLRELWWRFKTSGVSDGKLKAGDGPGVRFPTVRMQHEGGSIYPTPYECITTVAPVIEQWNSGLFPTQLEKTIEFVETTIDNEGHDWEDDGNLDDLRLAPDLPSYQDGEFETYFLKVTRDSNWMDSNACNSGITTFVSYHTDLTYIVPHKLEMWAELDDDLGAEDNLLLNMGFDARGFTIPPLVGSGGASLEEPSEGSTHVFLHGQAPLKGYYVDRVWPNIWEIDEAAFIGPWEPCYPGYGCTQFEGIGTLSSWDVSTPAKGESDEPWVPFSDGPNSDEADYYYYFYYKACHLETEPACANP